MEFHLQGGGLYPAERQNRFQLRDGHVAHAEVANQPFVRQVFALSPGCHEFLHGERPGIRISGITAAARRMIIGEGPVDKIQVQAGKPQVCQAFFAGFQHLSFSVHVVPDLGGDKQFFPGYFLFGEKPFQHPADFLFVLIDRGTVNQSVAGFNGAVDRFGDGGGIVFIGTEGADSHAGNFLAGTEFSGGN